MATLDTIRPIATENGLRTFLVSLAGGLATWNDRRMTRKALSALSARELDDIGLNRADIERM